MRLYEMLELINITFDKTRLDDFEVKSLLPPNLASKNDVSYINNDKYLPLLEDCKAGAILLSHKHCNINAKNVIFVENPHLVFAYLSHFFATNQIEQASSQQPNNSDCKIYEGVFLGKNVRIANGVTIMPNAVICDNVSIGENTTIYPNVTIYKDCVIGKNVKIHAGCVIGSDGFGYAHTKTGEHIKIEHFGNVIIEDDVEIGANTTIDRAVFNSTIIEKGTKIDNLVQIGHNCVIGKHSIIVAQCGISGSTTMGRNVVIGGQSGTKGHLHIGDFVQVAAKSGVSKNLPSHTKWSGYPIAELYEWQKMQVKLRNMLRNMD